MTKCKKEKGKATDKILENIKRKKNEKTRFVGFIFDFFFFFVLPEYFFFFFWLSLQNCVSVVRGIRKML